MDIWVVPRHFPIYINIGIHFGFILWNAGLYVSVVEIITLCLFAGVEVDSFLSNHQTILHPFSIFYCALVGIIPCHFARLYQYFCVFVAIIVV